MQRNSFLRLRNFPIQVQSRCIDLYLQCSGFSSHVVFFLAKSNTHDADAASASNDAASTRPAIAARRHAHTAVASTASTASIASISQLDASSAALVSQLSNRDSVVRQVRSSVHQDLHTEPRLKTHTQRKQKTSRLRKRHERT